MDELELERLGRAWKSTKDQADALYTQLHEALIEGFNAGIPTMVLAERTGLARELVRRTLKAADEAGRLTRPRPRSKA